MKRFASIVSIVLALAALTSCGPSAEQVATLTASAWTATPPPTPVPTLVPYDLTVTVTDEAGAPIPAAAIVFAASGTDLPRITDAQGQFDFTGLPGSDASVDVTGQGYLLGKGSATLVRGPNEIKVTLKPDPAGLLSAAACASGEKLLYAEDFQDGQAQGWNEIDLKTPGWNIVPAVDNPADQVVSAEYSDMITEGGLNSRLEGFTFDNAVWRIHYQLAKPFVSRESWFSFNWRIALEPFDLNGVQIFDSRYQIPQDNRTISLRRLQQPATNIGIGNVKGPKLGDWHLAEISTYQGVTETWIDGKRLMSYNDPKPVPPGTIGLELRIRDPGVTVYFNNISVCELSAPMQSISPAPQ